LQVNFDDLAKSPAAVLAHHGVTAEAGPGCETGPCSLRGPRHFNLLIISAFCYRFWLCSKAIFRIMQPFSFFYGIIQVTDFHIFVIRAVLAVVFAVVLTRVFHPDFQPVYVAGLAVILVGLAYLAEFLRQRKK